MTRNDSLHTGPAVPGFVVRMLLPAVAAIAAWQVIPLPVWQWIAIMAAVVAAVFPRTLGAWAVAGIIPFTLLFMDVDPLRTCAAVLVVHLLHVLGSLTLVVPMRARVVVSALIPTGRRFLGVQVVSQAVTVATLLLQRGAHGFAEAWAAPVGAAALIVAAGMAVVMISRARHDAGPRRIGRTRG